MSSQTTADKSQSKVTNAEQKREQSSVKTQEQEQEHKRAAAHQTEVDASHQQHHDAASAHGYSREAIDQLFLERLKDQTFFSSSSKGRAKSKDDTGHSAPEMWGQMPQYDDVPYEDMDDPEEWEAGYTDSFYAQDPELTASDEAEYAQLLAAQQEEQQHYQQLEQDPAQQSTSFYGKPLTGKRLRERKEALDEVQESYRQHYASRFQQDGGTELEEKEEAFADSAQVAVNLGMSREFSASDREMLRLYLAQHVYSRPEIYADPYYLHPVDVWESEVGAEAQESFSQSAERWGRGSILQCAYDCPKLISRVSVAMVSYLQLHFPLGNDEDQEQFNLLLLVLCAKMEEGDICVNLSSLNSVYETIALWEEDAEQISLHLNSVDDGDFTYTAPELFERMVMMAKRYAPLSVESMHELLHKAIAVGTKDDRNSPLVFDLQRLYLRRYYNYEQSIASYIQGASAPHLSEEQESFLQQAVEVLFPEQSSVGVGEVNWQKVAALMATTSNFTVVSGGPGTGKTTTVLRMLLLLVCMDPQNRLIELCAPTGKAAARMGESILKQIKDPHTSLAIEQLSKLSGLSPEEIRSFIPLSAVTVQRLLKVRPNHATPIFNAEHKLLCDVLVVDEVSMLDMALFYRLLQAIEPSCKLILLGDKDQLSSVEAGAVLAELCARLSLEAEARIQELTLSFLCRMSGYSPQQLLQGKIAEHVVLLLFSYRSKDVPEIGQLAALVNNAPSAADSTGHTAELGQLQRGDIYTYLQRKSELEYIAGNADLLAHKGAEHGQDDPCMLQLERIHELFAHTESQCAQELGLDLKAIQKAKDYERKSTSAKGTRGKKSSLNKASLGEGDFPPFKPAISYTKLNAYSAGLFDDELSCSQVDGFKLYLARKAVARGVKDNYAPFLERLEQNHFVVSSDLQEREELFKLMDRFRMLCSNHHGALGDNELNLAICDEVKRTYLQGYGYFGAGDFFPGQIIIITKNDPIAGLVNGYVGFCAYEEKSTAPAAAASAAAVQERNGGGSSDPDRVLRVFIPVGVEEKDGRSVTKVNVISTLLLTNYDTGFAMSIHKSQGSEYDKVTMVLSDRINRVLTKELVYTGITRAKKCVEVVSSDSALLYAISHSVDRESGLAERLKQNAHTSTSITTTTITTTP